MIDTGSSSRKTSTMPPSRGIKRVVAAALVAAAATVTLSAWSVAPHMGEHGPRGHFGMHGGAGPAALVFGGPALFMGAQNPEHAGRMVDRMLDGLNATDAQRTQIKEIVRTAAADLKSLRDKGDGRALRDKSLQLFSSPTIDASAVDGLRQQMEAQRSQFDKRMMQAMIDVGRVLTPEQRVKVAQNVRFQADRRADAFKRMQERREAQGGNEGRHLRGPASRAPAGATPDAPPAPPVR